MNKKSSTELEKYINQTYNSRRVQSLVKDGQTSEAEKFHIKDFGKIVFAVNGRESQYVRIPFVLSEQQKKFASTLSSSQKLTNDQNPVIALRAEIEHQIKETFKIPIIQILANDDASSVMTVCNALRHGTPIILIEGTGQVANEFAKWYRHLYGCHLMNPQVYRSDAIYAEARRSTFEIL
ncbi:unnamed protein product [Rotaria sordida]|uniref:Uncharacterized protein n=1 Tax=Rotaria sordida TaxID=392033 RepID=A0A814JYX5_9BILA|nr:unnamed protein product [Rotaria sordida]CAF1198213.1 unnamed protein product [Rotaria sordida]